MVCVSLSGGRGFKVEGEERLKVVLRGAAAAVGL